MIILAQILKYIVDRAPDFQTNLMHKIIQDIYNPVKRIFCLHQFFVNFVDKIRESKIPRE